MEDARRGKRGAPRSPPAPAATALEKMSAVSAQAAGLARGDVPCRAAGRAAVLGVLQDQALGVCSSLGNWVL